MERYEDTIHSLTVKQLESSRSMVQKIFNALEDGKMDKDFASELLVQIREQINNTYIQRIELAIHMNQPYENIDDNRLNELKSFDAAVNMHLGTKVEVDFNDTNVAKLL